MLGIVQSVGATKINLTLPLTSRVSWDSRGSMYLSLSPSFFLCTYLSISSIIYLSLLSIYHLSIYLSSIYLMKYYSATKKWKLAICNSTDGPGGYYAYWSKSDRERQILYGVTYIWNLKNNQIVNIAKQKQTHGYREQASGYQWGEGREEDQDRGRG